MARPPRRGDEKKGVFVKYHEEVSYPRLQREGSLESMWMAGAVDHRWNRREAEARKGVLPFQNVAEGMIVPSAVRAQRRLAELFPRPEIKKRSHFTEIEEMRLKELEAKLLKHKKNPYLRSQKKLKTILKRKRPCLNQPTLAKSTGAVLMPVLERYRIEKQAVAILVRAYRKYYRRQMLLQRRQYEKNALKIQSAARAFVTRKLVSLWWLNSQRLAVMWQSRLRTNVDLARAAMELHEDQVAALRIQRVVRGFIGRCRFFEQRQSTAVALIQRVWRGSRGRYQANSNWLDRLVCHKMQSHLRRYLSMRRSRRYRDKVIEKANAISRVYRGYRARRVRGHELNQREKCDLELILKELAAQRVHCDDLANRYKKKIQKRQTMLTAKREGLRDSGHAVAVLESEYLRLKLDYETCTPRSISSGWHAELKNAVADHREKITQAKAKALFDTDAGLYGLRVCTEALRFEEETFQEFSNEAHFADLARESELRSLWARSSRSEHDALLLEKRQKIADQKRKWRLNFFNPNGKPLKNNTTILNLPTHENSVDLFAHIHQGNNEIDTLAARLRLQQWQNQVAQLESLFQPFKDAFAPPFANQLALHQRQKNTPAPSSQSQEITLAPSSQQSPTSMHTSPPISPKQAEAPRLQDIPQHRRPRPARPAVSRIPWSLLDELDAEKHKFETQRAFDLSFAPSSS